MKVLDFGLAKLSEKLPIGAVDATRMEKPVTEQGNIPGKEGSSVAVFN